MKRRLMLSLALGALAVAGTAVAQQKAAKPLNIVVYGGSGNIGSRIVNEAVARGHHVTVVDRAPKSELAPQGVKLVSGDAMSATDIAKNINGADVVVSSVIVRPTPTPDFALNIVKAMVTAQRTQTGAKKTRLLVVGGASSLNNAEGKRIVDTLPPTLPAGTLNEIKSAVDALDYIRTVNDTSWTFFSPASNIRPGTRTGKFRTGTDQLVVDAAGQSAISMEDFAVAMLDEIEKPQFVNKRFTVGY
ncbi:MAG: NAD(P)H-binding protein [Steroidobacteraceae bacterium]